MDRETRIVWLVDHYRRPRHRGKLEDADVQVPGGNPGCGDLVTLYLKAEDGEDRVAAVSFEGVGCTLSQAAASILAERTNREQPTFAAVLAFSYEEMMDPRTRYRVFSPPLRAAGAGDAESRRPNGGDEPEASGGWPDGRGDPRTPSRGRGTGGGDGSRAWRRS